MINLEKGNRVIASAELLSEMEALEIHGGNMGGAYDTEAVININCAGAKCSNCSHCNCPEPKPKDVSQCSVTNVNCGTGASCV